MSIAAAPLARVTSAVSAKLISTVPAPVATVTSARVSPVRLTATSSPVASRVTPGTPTRPIDASEPLAAIRGAACVASDWSVVDRIRTPISPPVAFTPSSSAVS